MTFLIVDATAGYRLMWKGKDTRYTVFLDKRLECKPDILCDDRQLPLRDHIADVIICDPPHIIDSTPIEHKREYKDRKYVRGRTFNIQHDVWTITDILKAKFGQWSSRTQWINYAYHTNTEFRRTIKENGKIHYKIIDGKSNGTINLRQIKEIYSNWTLQNIGENHTAASHYMSNPAIWLTLTPKKPQLP
jgi:hypothetical protein